MKKVWQITGPESGPHVLLLAGVHGDEYEPMITLVELASELDGAISRGRVTIDPLVNPGAYVARSRFGDDGLDLARICPGSNVGSSSEQAAYVVSQRIKEADAVIDLHTGGLGLEIYPLVGYMLHEDKQVLEQQRQLSLATGMPLIWGTDHRPKGRTLSVARDAGVPAVYLEYGGGTGFRRYVVDHYKTAVKRMLAQLDMLEYHATGERKWQYWLEDYRQDSGHLQAKMPAPEAGIFVADVSVGDWVAKGQRFGYIVNPRNGQSNEVFAGESGLVFLLSSRVLVEKGDALGGIMEVIPNEKIIIE